MQAVKPTKLLALPFVTALLTLALTGTAVAEEGGTGWIGEVNDKVITAFGLGLVVFLTLLVVVLSTIHSKLEKRKKAKR